MADVSSINLTPPVFCPFSSDVNECMEGTHGCDEKATCVNTKGSHECRCETGYHGDGKSCQGKYFLQDSVYQSCAWRQAFKVMFRLISTPDGGGVGWDLERGR